MKYLTEYRAANLVKALSQKIHCLAQGRWKIMEICGGQTHSIAKYGLLELLPEQVELVHGPGCPVCVTPKVILDQALQIAQLPNVIFCTFGDMLRVPGSTHDLLGIKALGADVRMLYSPLEAVELAQRYPDKEVVLFAVGFETTAPAHAMAVKQAAYLKLSNFSLLASLVLVPPAMEYILQSPLNQVQGFLAAGHVCTVMGESAYYPIAQQYKVPIVITGFEPVDILQGIYHCILQLEQQRHKVENHYLRWVKPHGNQAAQALLKEIFAVVDQPWRGIGTIPASGLQLKASYASYDASRRYALTPSSSQENKTCISGEILQGLKKPFQCPAFARQCTPLTPLGAPMVSTEGACAAYYRYCGK